MPLELDARAAGARRLADKVCVVTGAGQGIGRAAAKRLGQEGGKIVVADRIEAAAGRTLAELREHRVAAMQVLVDVSTFAGAHDLMARVLDAYGRVDVLVNNVGGTIWIKPYHLYSEAEVKLELERSLYPTLWCCLAVLPIMMQQNAGSIVNLGSQSVRGLYRLPYAVSKGGILALTKVLAMEYGRYGIRITRSRPAARRSPIGSRRGISSSRGSRPMQAAKRKPKITVVKWRTTFATSRRCNGAACRKNRPPPSPSSPPMTRASSPDR